MLIAIVIAEEILGLQRIALVPEPSGGPPWAPHEPIFFEDFLRLRHMGVVDSGLAVASPLG